MATSFWEEFINQQANMFIWEAFVSGKGKAATHTEDARLAADEFWEAYLDVPGANSVPDETPYSLVGAVLRRVGLSADLSLLSQAVNITDFLLTLIHPDLPPLSSDHSD